MDFDVLRKRMIDVIIAYGIKDRTVLNAMAKVPRHYFVPGEYTAEAYSDYPIQIGHEQTISQPFTVAFMLEALELQKGNKVLEVGCGSGYNAALIKEITGGEVYSVEIIKELVYQAKKNLARLNTEVEVVHGDGSKGLPEKAPFDRIILTAACPKFPELLVEQLKEAGIILVPVGAYYQVMLKAVKKNGKPSIRELGEFRFVPMKGKHGF